MDARISDTELVALYGEACYQIGYRLGNRAIVSSQTMKVRDALRAELLARLGGEEPAVVDEAGAVEAPALLLALLPVVYALARHKQGPEGRIRRETLFCIIQEFNVVLRPVGWEYALRQGPLVTVREPIRRWTVGNLPI